MALFLGSGVSLCGGWYWAFAGINCPLGCGPIWWGNKPGSRPVRPDCFCDCWLCHLVRSSMDKKGVMAPLLQNDLCCFAVPFGCVFGCCARFVSQPCVIGYRSKNCRITRQANSYCDNWISRTLIDISPWPRSVTS